MSGDTFSALVCFVAAIVGVIVAIGWGVEGSEE